MSHFDVDIFIFNFLAAIQMRIVPATPQSTPRLRRLKFKTALNLRHVARRRLLCKRVKVNGFRKSISPKYTVESRAVKKVILCPDVILFLLLIYNYSNCLMLIIY